MVLTDNKAIPIQDSEEHREDASIVADLRRARLSKNLEISAIAGDLRIRRDYLAALEAGDASALPERVYTLGFVRSYARYLDMNIEDVLKRFKLEVLQDDQQANYYDPPKPMNENTRPNRKILLISVAILFLSFGAWFYWFHQSKTVTPDFPIDETVTTSPSSMPLDGGSAASSDLSERKEAEVKETPQASNASSNEPDSLAPGQPMDNMADTPKGASVPQENPTTSVASKDGLTPVIRVIEPTWVEIYQQDGTLIKNHLFQVGEAFPRFPHGVLITVGNAGGLYLDGDGASGPLGKSGDVMRRFSLMPLASTDHS